jgi:hypothetical protein
MVANEVYGFESRRRLDKQARSGRCPRVIPPVLVPDKDVGRGFDLTVLIQALVPPAIFVRSIMQPTDQVCVMVESIGSSLSFLVILAVVARGRLLFRSLLHNTELLVSMLNNLL